MLRALWKKELQSMFFTPIGYVFTGFFLLVSGYFFWLYNLSASSSDMQSFFERVAYILMLFTPILTMRLFSEEKRGKTDQLLLTAPLPLVCIVAGKLLAAATVLLLTLLLSFVYPLVIGIFGTLSVGSVLVHYLGCFFLGCAYLSVGALVSCLCENQVTAAVVALVANVMLQVLESLPSLFSASSPFVFLGKAMGWLTLNTRYHDFAVGILSMANVVYFVSFCAVMVCVTIQLLGKRRWQEG